MAAGDVHHVVGSLTPSRHAVKFIATADEAFLIDVFATARRTAGDAAGTVTAWINVPDITGTYGIWSCGDTAAIEFLSLRVEAGKITAECNDATSDEWEHTTTNIVLTPHKWHHIALTQTATLEAPKIYVDGKKISDMTATLETDNAAWFGQCQLIDDGSIGADEEAGAGAQIDEFKGGISDVKYWDVTLTAEQVERDYRGQAPDTITGTSGDLLDWWKMIDVVDSVTAANFGVAGASLKFCPEYSEFTSKMAFLGQVVADDICISVNEREGHCVLVTAA